MISDANIFVDRDRCYACGICVDRCIMDNLRLSVPPCRQACPLRMNCMGYVRLMAMGRERKAAEEMRKYTPFGGILGRICSHPCEDVCERRPIDGAVHIRALKRYLADTFPDIASRIPAKRKETGRQAAVVGSGPAGLMTAFELRSRGHAVTVFESESHPGGLLRNVIPSYRLPVSEVERAAKILEEMGVIFKTDTALGQDMAFENLTNEFDALVLAMGAGKPMEPDIPFHELPGVIQGLEFLKQVKAGERPKVGPSVIVIGGGNSAVDAALTCYRMGIPEVKMVCLERSREMPAFGHAVRDVLDAGIVIENGWGPTRFRAAENDTVEMEATLCLSAFDDQGDFNPQFDSTCVRSRKAHTIILALGQSVDLQGLPDNLMHSKAKGLAAEPLTRQTLGDAKVFVCGDFQAGPTSVVNAMASGRETAVSVDRLLCGEGLRWGRDFWNRGNMREYTSDPSRVVGGPRGELPHDPVSKGDMTSEFENCLSSETAKNEAARCLSCGRAAEINKTCWYCLPCEIECPTEALKVRMPYQVR